MSMFGFNVNKFVSEIGKSGVAYPHRYEILFGSTRTGAQLFDRGTSEKLNARLESVSLPGSGIGSTPVKLQGIDREMPYGRMYEGDIKMVFLEDSTFNVRKAFEGWQRAIIDEETFQCGYYDEYTCNSLDITMTGLKNKEEVYKVRVFDLFPKTVNAVELSGGGGDALVKTDIDFSFRRWTSNFENEIIPRNGVDFQIPSSDSRFA
jgi:hypothetical protein